VPRAVRGEFLDVVTEHFNSEMSSQDAVDALAAAIARVASN
jgi:glucose/mannose transport system substrate-binding protein